MLAIFLCPYTSNIEALMIDVLVMNFVLCG
jgi:hypothetical protein